MMIYQRYPLTMTHPSFRPAVLSDSDARFGEHGQAAAYPPVIVNNEDQEEYHKSLGYVSPPDARAAFETQQAAPEPAGYQGPTVYPRWENGKLVQDPNAPIDNKTWPMWVTPGGKEPRIVKGPAEYEEAMGRPYNSALPSLPSPVTDDPDMAEFRAWKAARAAMAAQDSERSELLAIAEELGLEIDKRWSTKRLREELDAATAVSTENE